MKSVKISLLWMKGRSGIEGNEKVDALVKKSENIAANNEKISHQYALKFIKG